MDSNDSNSTQPAGLLFVQYLFFAKLEKGKFFSKKTIKIIGVPLSMKYVLRASGTVAKKKL